MSVKGEMKTAIWGVVVVAVTSLIIAAIVDDASAQGACVTLASGAVGSLGGYLTAHKKEEMP